MSSLFESLKKVVLERRTSKDYNGSSIDEAVLRKILELGIFAPNHRMTEPWKFYVFTQTGVSKYLDFLKSTLSSEEQTAFAKPLEKLPKVGALVLVTSTKSENHLIEEENYAAVAAAMEHILLGATAEGLSSYWSTAKIFSHPLSIAYLKINQQIERFVGAIWLGRGAAPAPRNRKPLDEKSIWFR